ncbi:MAG: hypothetical protein AB7K09_07940 [Planctomycetota bacterium]
MNQPSNHPGHDHEPPRPVPVLSFHVPRVEDPGRRPTTAWSRMWRALFLRGSRRMVFGAGALVFAASQAALIAWLALRAPKDLPASTLWLLHSDKLVHAVAFGWLAGWTMIGLHHITRWHVGWTCAVSVLAAGVGWGAGIEFAQAGLTTYRVFELLDILADIVGAIVVTSVLVLTASDQPARASRRVA